MKSRAAVGVQSDRISEFDTHLIDFKALELEHFSIFLSPENCSWFSFTCSVKLRQIARSSHFKSAVKRV